MTALIPDITADRTAWLAQHMGPAASDPSSLMIVLATEEDRHSVEAIAAPCRWKLYRAGSCEEAVRFARHTHPRVLLCDEELPDGNWRRIWKALSIGPDPPLLVVASRNADERLWSQVLNSGAYDLLAKPFRTEEVVWTLHCAAGAKECESCHSVPGMLS